MSEREQALEQIRRYVAMRLAKPLKGFGDGIHAIHLGTEWEAELTLSDLQAALADRPEQPVINEANSMIQRNPAPDASMPMVPSDSHTCQKCAELKAAESQLQQVKADAERYRWLRELPNANSLNVKFCGADLDKVSDAGITDAARRNDGTA